MQNRSDYYHYQRFIKNNVIQLLASKFHLHLIASAAIEAVTFARVHCVDGGL